jgi:hypothetical protein
MFKNRSKLTFKKPNLRLGQIGIAFSNEGRFEMKYIFQIKKLVKKLKRRKFGKKRRI